MADDSRPPSFEEVLHGLTRPAPAMDLGAPSSSLRVCPYCSQQHAASMVCADDPMRRVLLGQHDRASAPLPPLDPFTPGAEASAALAEMYSDLCTAGIPVASVESILGHMLAAYQLGKDGAAE